MQSILCLMIRMEGYGMDRSVGLFCLLFVCPPVGLSAWLAVCLSMCVFYVCMHSCTNVRMCVCVRVCVLTILYNISMYVRMNVCAIYAYISICVCVCVYVCTRLGVYIYNVSLFL